MKLRTYTYVSRDSMLRTVELLEPGPPHIDDALLEICDAVVFFDEPAPGLMRDDAQRARRAKAHQEPTDLDKADSEVFRRAHTEWVLVPPKEEGWIDAKYESCRTFFADHPLHEPDITLEALLADPRARNRKPPLHAKPDEITASWDTVAAAKKALESCLIANGKEWRAAHSLVNDYASPWQPVDRSSPYGP